MFEVINSRASKTEQRDGELEKVAIAGAAAIQQIIAERDELRTYVETQRRELAALSAVNDNFRRTITLIRHHYVELGTRILRELEQFDAAFNSVTHPQNETESSSEHANLVALAQRLKPRTAVRNSADGVE